MMTIPAALRSLDAIINGFAVPRFAPAFRVTDDARRNKWLSVRFGEDCGRLGRFLHQSDGERSPGRGRAVKAGAATASGE
jgi:hypothetical protein